MKLSNFDKARSLLTALASVDAELAALGVEIDAMPAAD